VNHSGAEIRFDQIGGLDGIDGQLLSQFTSTNTGDQLQVDVVMGMGQELFQLELFNGESFVGAETVASDSSGRIVGNLSMGVVDFLSYELSAIDGNTIRLTATLAEPTSFRYNGQLLGVGDRATITNAGGDRQLTSFQSIDIFAANTEILLDRVLLTAPPDGDFDMSGSVDATDLNLVLFNWNKPGASFPAEWVHMRPADDAPVSAVELNKVLFTWNQSFPRSAAVPEPSAIVLVGAALIGTLGVPRRR